jgi:hypothetical protein
VILPLIAEVLSGETLVTPGGCVDGDTACSREAFTWDGWLEELLVRDEQREAAVEVQGSRVQSAELPLD